MKVQTDIFLMGLIVGWGPCFTHCALILLPYIAGIHKGWRESLKATLIFSLAKIIPYIILSLIAASLGNLMVRCYYESSLSIIVFLIISLLLIISGLFLMVGGASKFSFCDKVKDKFLVRKRKGLILLGLLVDFSPCIPLFGVLAYIAYESKTILDGLILGSCFALGNLLSPLILLGVLAGGMLSFALRKPIVNKIINIILGSFLIYFGIRILVGLSVF